MLVEFLESLGSGLLGSVIGAIAIIVHQMRRDDYMLRVNTVMDILSSRYKLGEINNDKFFEGLGRSLAVFRKDKNVREAILEYHKYVRGKGGDEKSEEQILLAIFRAMLGNVGMNDPSITDEFLLYPFKPRR